jgi:hypothetical protein
MKKNSLSVCVRVKGQRSKKHSFTKTSKSRFSRRRKVQWWTIVFFRGQKNINFRVQRSKKLFFTKTLKSRFSRRRKVQWWTIVSFGGQKSINFRVQRSKKHFLQKHQNLDFHAEGRSNGVRLCPSGVKGKKNVFCVFVVGLKVKGHYYR